LAGKKRRLLITLLQTHDSSCSACSLISTLSHATHNSVPNITVQPRSSSHLHRHSTYTLFSYHPSTMYFPIHVFVLLTTTILAPSILAQDFGSSDVPNTCRNMCQPVVDLSSLCLVSNGTNLNSSEEKAEDNCICDNHSFDVAAVAPLCANCISQNNNGRAFPSGEFACPSALPTQITCHLSTLNRQY